ncbi:unnamed protein product, partial [Rotaria sp. Silwood2]
GFYIHYRSIRQYYFIHDHPTWVPTERAHNWLHRHQIIDLYEYPSASPDLNAIELVWSWMNHFVQQRRPSSQQHVEQLVIDAWDQIPRSVIRNYIDHIQVICHQVIANQGWESS